jgi:hypothetical protein
VGVDRGRWGWERGWTIGVCVDGGVGLDVGVGESQGVHQDWGGGGWDVVKHARADGGGAPVALPPACVPVGGHCPGSGCL